MWGIGEIIGAIIGGFFIGLLGKVVAPGDRKKIPLWLTILCGIGGILLGNWLYVDVFNFAENTNGFDWWRHTWQVGVAAALVVVAAGATGRNKKAITAG
ncbi:MAG TPA: hypothetical protein VLI04_09615 [Nocardioidaceae bacterium]|nr:hypothetical protein [Nocardioidaceae bacterium]